MATPAIEIEHLSKNTLTDFLNLKKKISLEDLTCGSIRRSVWFPGTPTGPEIHDHQAFADALDFPGTGEPGRDSGESIGRCFHAPGRDRLPAEQALDLSTTTDRSGIIRITSRDSRLTATDRRRGLQNMAEKVGLETG